MNHPVLPELPGTKLPTRVHMEGFKAPAAYVAEDGPVGHQRVVRPLFLLSLNAPVLGNGWTGKKVWVGYLTGGGRMLWEGWSGKEKKG